MSVHNRSKNSKASKPQAQNLQPEASYRVVVDETAIICTTPWGDTSTITFAELESVIIRTTDEGPFASDVFWVFTAADHTCIVPMGATGEEALIDKLAELPGFDFKAMIDAMSSAENQEFECWKR